MSQAQALRLDSTDFPSAEKKKILKSFWNVTLSEDSEPSLARYDLYFQFYCKEMKALSLGPNKNTHILTRIAAKTHHDIRLIVERLKQKRDLNLEPTITEIKALFPSYKTDDDAIRSSIDLAMRVWLILNIRDRSTPVHVGNMRKLRWEKGQEIQETLKNFVDRQIPSMAHVLPEQEDYWDGRSTAYDINHLYKISIVWTHCLADHLRLDFEARTLYIFPHKACLVSLYNDVGGDSGTIYSKELIEETLWSLNLLFPFDNDDATNLLEGLGGDFHTYPPYTRPLDLNQYPHWRTRLSRLRKLLDSPPPLNAMFRDFRNTYTLYTLWTAITIFLLTIVFGIISSATAIISTRAALRSLTLADQALQLQIEQNAQQ